MDRRPKSAATIDQVKIIERTGPWTTKSGGNLNVLFSIPFDILKDEYFHYDKEELEHIGKDIRGLRSYSVDDIEKNSTGANEWHRIRSELVFTTQGEVEWICEDIYGNNRTYIIDSSRGLWIPPFMLHSYRSTAMKSSLLVIANTLFIPEDQRTHDTFSADAFKEIQAVGATSKDI